MLRYYQHFGLQRDPFLDTSDPQFYLELPVVRRNMRRLLSGIEESRGLTVVIGPPGAGKTSLSSSVELTLLSDDNVIIGKILDPTFASDLELLLAIARSFGLHIKSRSRAVIKNALKNFLFDAVVVERRTLVLLIDEAQNLTVENLETLRLLLNFQIPQKKLLNVILFGQEELLSLIGSIENFDDNVDTYVRLEPLERAGSAAIIEHRLMQAGKMPMVLVIAPDALERAIVTGAGLPRRLINIVRSAMVEAADRGAEMVQVEHVVAALHSRGLPSRIGAERDAAPSEKTSETGSGASRFANSLGASGATGRAPLAAGVTGRAENDVGRFASRPDEDGRPVSTQPNNGAAAATVQARNGAATAGGALHQAAAGVATQPKIVPVADSVFEDLDARGETERLREEPAPRTFMERIMSWFL